MKSLLRSAAFDRVRMPLLIFGCLVVVIIVPCDAKGVMSPSPTDEYLARFFQPNSLEDPEVSDDNNQGGRPDSRECVCEPTTTTSTPDAGSQSLDMDNLAAAMENIDRLGDMFAKVATLESRVSEMERSSNKLKKLSLAAMIVALADDGEGCTEAEGLGIQNLIKGFPALTVNRQTQFTPAQPCDGLGTAARPASSCKQLQLACHKPSGPYFIDNGYFTQVYCEMDLFGGGWTRYGKAGMQTEWNFIDEDLIEVSLEIMDPRDVKEMIDMKYNTFRIHTDVTFSLQADDSTNPSKINARILPWFQTAPFYIDGYGENFTRLEFLAGGDRITCRNMPGTSHKCGWGRVPRPNEQSDQILIETVYFGPRASGNGASAYMDEWRANRYTWHGTYYYVYAK